MRAALLALICVHAAALLSGTAVAFHTSATPGRYEVRFHGDLQIKMWDNETILRADAVSPVPSNASQRFPLIIFPNSWGLPQFEYILAALKWAEHGYVCLEYETRGWYLSGGEIDTAGPLDRMDASAVIDFALSLSDQWAIDSGRIAFVGISYGGGIALQMAGYDSRVTTVAAMSGWGNLTDALYGHHTPNKLWGQLLVLAADILGHPQPQLSQLFNDLLTHRNISAVRAFADERGAAKFLNAINARRVPVFMSNNLDDMLFRPEDAASFWSRLEGPKLLLLNDGGHAEAEITGLLGVNTNFVWNEAKLWLDYYLKGDTQASGITKQPRVQVELNATHRVNFRELPDRSNTTQYTTLYFVDRSDATFGKLSTTPVTAYGRRGRLRVPDAIAFEAHTGLSLGIPVISNYLTPFLRPTAELAFVSRGGAVVYMSEHFAAAATICGTPTFTAQLIPNSPTYQLFGYLYSVDGLNVGTLQSHSFSTHYADDQLSARRVRGDGQVSVAGTFHSVCFTVPAGQRIAVGLSLSNGEYQEANTQLGFTFVYSSETSLTLPVVDPA